MDHLGKTGGDGGGGWGGVGVGLTCNSMTPKRSTQKENIIPTVLCIYLLFISQVLLSEVNIRASCLTLFSNEIKYYDVSKGRVMILFYIPHFMLEK